MRLLHEFDERWDCAGLRLMENSFDNAHFSFVHMASFGNQAQPAPASIEITPLDYGLNMKTTVDVMNPPLHQKNLQLAAAKTVRMMDANWYIAVLMLVKCIRVGAIRQFALRSVPHQIDNCYMPFIRTLKITYPNGVMHLLFTAATPISDRASHIIQFCVRNDTLKQHREAEQRRMQWHRPC